MKSALRQRVIELRTKGELSYSEIKRRLGVSKSTLSYWLKDFPLSEARILELKQAGWKKAEVKYERYRNTMRKKRNLVEDKVYCKYKQGLAHISDREQFVVGLALYLAEGDKTTSHRLLIANTDARLIKFFISWMEKFLGVERNKIKVTLHLYENMAIKEERDYWQNELGLRDEQFYKMQIRTLQKSSFSYQESFRHGTCAVYYGSVEKKREVTMAIKALFENLAKNF